MWRFVTCVRDKAVAATVAMATLPQFFDVVIHRIPKRIRFADAFRFFVDAATAGFADNKDFAFMSRYLLAIRHIHCVSKKLGPH